MQNQKLPLNLECTFDIDSLPIAFGSLEDDGTFDRTKINNIISKLAEIIWEKGGFRFWHRKTYWADRAWIYFCSQDEERVRESVAQGKRDTPRMARFPCKSRLTFKPALGDRTLAVNLQHIYHTPYTDRQLSPAVVEFIQARNAIATPGEIYRNLQTSQPLGWQSATPSQVYYLWQQSNSSIWRRDQDPLASAQILLSEHQECTSSLYFSENLRAIAFYVSDAIRILASRAKELAIDATFGTNNMGMDLFAVLAEVDGTGVPLAYCFTELFKDNDRGVRRAKPGASTGILEQFLRPLQTSGFDPTFFGTDKDSSEISAIRQVWPGTTIQLCCWHARRAVRTKLTSTRQTDSQGDYKPEEAQAVIPDLEICWGSMPTRRPNGPHRYGRCTCPSKSTDIVSSGRVETSTSDEQDTVLEIFTRHYNSHPFIPDQNGTFRSAEEIHRLSASEMYYWCRKRNYFRLWAYLWVNWYHPSQWVLWARSVNEKEIPVLKTTMIVESHWRKIKHDYLHRFNRPRIDLVVWVLLSRLIPSAMIRMRALLQHDHRQATASWRKDFKREWKKVNGRLTDRTRIQHYHTDPARWTCACPSFLDSRFLLCKHILSCYEPVSDRVDFFRSIQRRREPPFWTHAQLVLQPQYQPLQADTKADETNDVDMDGAVSIDSHEDFDPAIVEQDQLVELEEEGEDVEVDGNKFASNMQFALDVFREQQAKGNEKFVQKFMAMYGSIETLVEEVKALENRRTMRRTWDTWKHPLTMYHN